MKNVFYFIKEALFVLEIFKFLQFFPSFPNFSRFKRANWSGIIYDVVNWLAWICRCNFQNNSKTALYYNIKLGQIIYIYIKGIVLNLFCNLKIKNHIIYVQVFQRLPFSWSTRFVSLKLCVGFSIFDFVLFLLKVVSTTFLLLVCFVCLKESTC